MPFLNYIRTVESTTSTKLLTCEFEIIIFLLENPNSPPGKMISSINYSNTTFYSTLKKLLTAGIVTCSNSARDGRSNLYNVAERFLEACEPNLKMILFPASA